MITLSETTSPIKSLDRDHSGSIVFRFRSSGNVDVEIITDQSDEEETLRERLTMAGPALAFLQKMFTLDPVTNQESR